MHVGSLVHSADSYELRMNYVATADMLLAKAAQRLQNVSADNAWQILADLTQGHPKEGE